MTAGAGQPAEEDAVVDKLENPWILLAFLFFVALIASAALADGPVSYTFDQANNCAGIAAWRVLGVDITPVTPNPTPPAADGSTPARATITNVPSLTCGPGVVAVAPTAGAGPTRIWLQAVANASTPANFQGSPLSNSVDATLRPTAPFLKAVNP